MIRAEKDKSMRDANQTPTFNLKVVVRETGLKPDTLRAWERRYGMPQPHRTPGGHRLYSQYDIDTLKWMVDRQNEGLSISRAYGNVATVGGGRSRSVADYDVFPNADHRNHSLVTNGRCFEKCTPGLDISLYAV